MRSCTGAAARRSPRTNAHKEAVGDAGEEDHLHEEEDHFQDGPQLVTVDIAHADHEHRAANHACDDDEAGGAARIDKTAVRSTRWTVRLEEAVAGQRQRPAAAAAAAAAHLLGELHARADEEHHLCAYQCHHEDQRENIVGRGRFNDRKGAEAGSADPTEAEEAGQRVRARPSEVSSLKHQHATANCHNSPQVDCRERGSESRDRGQGPECNGVGCSRDDVDGNHSQDCGDWHPPDNGGELEAAVVIGIHRRACASPQSAATKDRESADDASPLGLCSRQAWCIQLPASSDPAASPCIPSCNRCSRHLLWMGGRRPACGRRP